MCVCVCVCVCVCACVRACVRAHDYANERVHCGTVHAVARMFEYQKLQNSLFIHILVGLGKKRYICMFPTLDEKNNNKQTKPKR